MNVRDIAVKYAHLLSAPDYSRLLNDADYIDWLRVEWQNQVAEIERLRNELDDAINKAYEEFAKYEADIERLKAERDEWRAVCTEDYEPRMGKLQAVVDAARHLLAGGDKEAVYHLERAIAALEQEK